MLDPRMKWQDVEYRAALLRLWETGVIKKTRKVQPLAEHLLLLGWVTQSSRQNELLLNEDGSAQLPALMDNIWPLWRQTLQQLLEANLPLTTVGLQELARKGRQLPPLPLKLHNKTFAALTGAHSKCSITTASLPPGLVLTADGVLRTRANRGLVIYAGQHRLTCDDLMQALGEIILPERAILDGIRVGGTLPRVIITVENLGPFVDMPKPDELLLIHQPGWNTPLSLLFLQAFGMKPNWHHFGDLDPEGLAIYQHLKHEGAKPYLFIPYFWDEYRESFSHQLCDSWPETITNSFSEPLLQRLFATSAWLEQEPIILDERLEDELVQLFLSEAHL